MIETKNDIEKVEDDPFKSNSYWKTMYEDLEDQMKQMMSMTLSLIESETESKDNEIETLKNKLKKQEKDLRKYKQFEHRVKVTWIGKIALLYIRIKSKIKRMLT